jgi:uncharacterized membrane protein SpoIIM required for sporulation
VYRATGSSWRGLLEFFTFGFARRLRAAGGYVATAAVLFFLPAILGYLAGWLSPLLRDILVPFPMRAIMAQGKTWTEIEETMRPAMATMIFTNNLQVSFTAFAGGALFGLLTVFVLLNNGLHIGSVLGAAHHYGVIHLLGDFVSAHGFVEISCILIAGAAGLMLGDGLLRPRGLRRRDAATRAARQAVELVLGASPLLVGIGLIEGFVSPSGLPTWFKLALGVVLCVLMWTGLLLAGRTPKAERTAF